MFMEENLTNGVPVCPCCKVPTKRLQSQSLFLYGNITLFEFDESGSIVNLNDGSTNYWKCLSCNYSYSYSAKYGYTLEPNYLLDKLQEEAKKNPNYEKELEKRQEYIDRLIRETRVAREDLDKPLIIKFEYELAKLNPSKE